MREFTHFILALATVVTLVTPASAGRFPKSVRYTFYVDGVRAGYSSARITETATELRFDSETQVAVGPNVLELASTTIADPVTFVVREFSFEGTKGGMPVESHVVLHGDSATGWVRGAGAEERSERSKVNKGGFVLFEDWLMDLEILMALRQRLVTDRSTDYIILFPNSFLTAELRSGYTGDAVVESETRSLVARKLELLMSGGSLFESLVDPATGLPVYLRFPGSRTEAFRDDFFGDNPVTRYSPPASGTSKP